ncbi:protein AIM2 [Sugiyamaella lignohabitans]|uniref:Protein AIM2 n=1 Tax=Sugiyamaella lignohabitans TaxID=796027 RepID=A0A167C4Q9_9ASCO|nr:protein AIM2 [Sugiyamaella lignohabitans]ANB11213.1 protein AIM2 [Sugiyamaella lignohabitans]
MRKPAITPRPAGALPQTPLLFWLGTTGESVGRLIDLNGVETYISGEKNASSKKAVLFLTDVFGHKYINNQLLADEYAKAGYLVVVPDLFKGDPRSPDSVPGADPNELRTKWLPNHTPEITRPIVEKAVEGLKKEYSPEFVGTVGYCFGARYVLQQLATDNVNAGAIAHPSGVTIEDVRAVRKPLLIIGAETDGAYTPELQKQTEDVLREIKATYFTTLASGVSHGFAVRGDITNPIVKFAKEKALRDTVDWFNAFNSRK